MSFSIFVRMSVMSMLALFLTACVSVPNFESMFYPYKSAKLQGENIKIMAEDNSFEIVSGEFNPPFQTSPMSPIIWTSIYSETLPDGSIYGRTLANSAIQALNHGAKRVRLYHPIVQDPLYGVLLLNQKPITAIGKASEAYLIQIPDKKIQALKEGHIDVLYESVERTDYTINMYAWVLWVSDKPFE